MNNSIVIENIKKLRQVYKLTQKELAQKLSVGRSTIGLIESGRSNPTDQLIHNISLVFGINEKWLETGQGPMRKSNEEIIKETIDLLDDINETEKAFLKMIAKKYQDENKEKANFYKLLHSLLTAFQQADRDTQGYITVQLKKSFPEYLEH